MSTINIKKRILILGGYGTFGSIISKRLAREMNIKVIISGRSEEKAKKFISTNLNLANPIEFHRIDIDKNFAEDFQKIKPDIVIDAIGPYDETNLKIANECLKYGCNYIDLADKFHFINRIMKMNEKAKEKNILMISGASSVPSISSAIVEEYKDEFQKVTDLEYSISTAAVPVPGVATLKSVLSDVGQEFISIYKGKEAKFHGWNNLKIKNYPEVGRRLLSDFPIPDNFFFPLHYKDLQSLKFYAGLGNPLFHLGVYFLSHLVKLGLFKNIEKYSDYFYFLASNLNFFHNSKSAFHMTITGLDINNKVKSLTFFITTRDGDGIYIPAIPSIVLAKLMVNEKIEKVGAYNSIGFMKLEMILEEMKDLKIKYFIE